MVRVWDIPALIEGACFENLQRSLGLLSDAVEAEVHDADLAAAARYYVGAYNRWEQSKAWREQVFPCRD